MRGEAHPGFRNDPDYRGWDWNTARAVARARDNERCTRCGATKGLIVHHIIAWELTHDNSLDNLLTLCRSCHMQVHAEVRAISAA